MIITEILKLLETINIGTEMANEKPPTVDQIYNLIDIDSDSDSSEEEKYAQAEEIYNFFIPLTNDKIAIYRVVKADEVDLDPYAIGESWSIYLDSAKQFARNNLSYNSTKELKIISGFVRPQNVDWKTTIDSFIKFSSLGDGDSEFELYIPPNRVIQDVIVSDFKTAIERN